MKPTIVLIAALMAAGVVARAAQDVPAVINYQGRLLNSAGAQVADGTYTVDFRIYNAPTGGTTLWGSSVSVSVVGGFFNVVLGDGGAAISGSSYPNIPPAMAATSTPFLGLTITSDNTGTRIQNAQEIVPRLRLVSSPYAVVSQYARQADEAAHATNASTLNGISPSQFLQPASPVPTTLSGDLTAPNLTVNGAARVNGSLAVEGDLRVSGTTQAGPTVGGGFVPIGGIILWSGSVATVPSGWALCDGTGTFTTSGQTFSIPDLRNRFIVGAGSGYQPGNTGGNTSVTLSNENMPPHTHTYKDTIISEASGAVSGKTVPNPDSLGSGADNPSSNFIGSGSTDSDNNYLVWVKRRSDSAGGSNNSATAFDIRPPFYALAYIIRVR